METIYWIQRLGAINSASTFFAVILGIAIVALIVVATYSRCLGEGYGDDDEDNIRYRACKRIIPKATIAFVVFTLGAIFVPSEKDLYAIYGIGGTIDYIKSNDTAKQLPDKVINALDAWLDDQNEKSKE